MRVLAIVPARGGSKGLPGKNIMPAAGRPLLAWSIDAAHGSRYVDRTVVSSDDAAVLDVARSCGGETPFRRPAELATDSAATVDVVLHALDQLPGHDLVVVLQPTSPLRCTDDIDAACEKLVSSGASSCVSVAQTVLSPYWMYRLGPGEALLPILELPDGVTRRQDLPPTFSLNGAVYVARCEWLRRSRRFVGPDTVACVMPAERSIDIDSLEDFEAFQRALNQGQHA